MRGVYIRRLAAKISKVRERSQANNDVAPPDVQQHGDKRVVAICFGRKGQ